MERARKRGRKRGEETVDPQKILFWMIIKLEILWSRESEFVGKGGGGGRMGGKGGGKGEGKGGGKGGEKGGGKVDELWEVRGR